MTFEATTIVCGGIAKGKVFTTDCNILLDGAWNAAGNLDIARARFTITPLTRISFLAYGK